MRVGVTDKILRGVRLHYYTVWLPDFVSFKYY